MSEFRLDNINKNWVLIAEGRNQRPDDFKQLPATPVDLPDVSPTCVFCPGNEKDAPGELFRYPKRGEWLIRVIPNKYEAVGHVLGKRHEDFYVSRPGVGDHEVVITRFHNQPTALQDESLIDLTLQTYIERINELKDHEEVRYIHIIQNHGHQAGGSMMHPHSQIFAIPFIPERIAEELLGTRSYFETHDACSYCEMIMFELRAQERIVLDTPDFLVATPFASKMPFTMHVLPKKHRASFHDVTISERKALAALMKQIFSRMHDRMKNPAYNYYFHTLPFAGTGLTKSIDDSKSYHWHMVILPRVNVWAGFELGTDVYVNPMPPEKAAKFFH